MDTQFIFWRLLPMPWWLGELVTLTTISTYLLLSAVMWVYLPYLHIFIYSILNTTIQSLCHYKSPDSILLHLSPTTKGLRFIDPEKPLPPAHCRAQAALSSSTIQALINFLHKRIGQINTMNYIIRFIVKPTQIIGQKSTITVLIQSALSSCSSFEFCI